MPQVLQMRLWHEIITDWLALLSHLVCMRPSVQGLLWDEFDGLNKDKLKILFFAELMI